MHPAVRLTKRPDGGFRIEGVAETPIDGVPDGDGFALAVGGSTWRLAWSAAERGWILSRLDGDRTSEVGRTTAFGLEPLLAPISVLLADGRLFRLAMVGASDPRVELGRWDVPGAYLVGRAEAGAWDLERTASGRALEAGPELWILACAELGRLDGWY
jgi:hypothetical protein